ncbi:MAG: phosphoglucosamine mutase [Chitinophagales bacterium]
MALMKRISGIRGTIGGFQGMGLTPYDIVVFASGYAQYVLSKHGRGSIVVGRDARISGEMVSSLVIRTLQGMGLDVVDLGLATTPTTAYMVSSSSAIGGIILTASHNPKDWNALKMLDEHGDFVSEEAGKEILRFSDLTDFQYATVDKLGNVEPFSEALDRHIEHILSLDLVNVEGIRALDLTIAVDGINSIGAHAVPKLLTALGVEKVKVIFEEMTGDFSHNPEPLPEHLTELSSVVKREQADLGIAVDPDVDRLAFIREDGEAFGEEYTLVAVADYVLRNTPGPTVSNISSSRALGEVTRRHGQPYHSSAVGEVNVVRKMKEVGAVIGGEGNGGIIYPESHYGRDALVGIALFLSHLAEQKKSVSALSAEYPKYIMSKQKMDLDPALSFDTIVQALKFKYKQYVIDEMDGLKITFDSDWVLIRPSNTEPILRIYSEGNSQNLAENIGRQIMQDIEEIRRQNVV